VKREGGQATVELVLALPVLAIILLAVVQLAVLAGTQVQVVDAARNAARVAAVDDDPGAAAAAARAQGLAADRLAVDVVRSTGTVTVGVSFHARARVPLVGAWCPDISLTARTTMPNELPKSAQPP
jgi:Flp pilus assembly protein TadG